MFFDREKPRYERMLETDLEHILIMLPTVQPDSDEYSKLLKSAERLHAMMDTSKPSRVSRETLITVGANLLGILMILKHEEEHVLVSKALSFIRLAK